MDLKIPHTRHCQKENRTNAIQNANTRELRLRRPRNRRDGDPKRRRRRASDQSEE